MIRTSFEVPLHEVYVIVLLTVDLEHEGTVAEPAVRSRTRELGALYELFKSWISGY